MARRLIRWTVLAGLIAAASGGARPARADELAEAEAARARGRHAEAAALLATYCESHPDDFWGHYLRGLALRKSGRPDSAVDAFRAGLALDPDHRPLLVNLGRAYLDLGRAGDALPGLERAVAADPDDVAARRVLATALHATGDRARALEEYREALRISPDDAWTLNNTGLLLIEEERFEEAVPLLERACRARDDVAVFRNNLGIACERSGRPAEAAAAYREALAIEPDHAKARRSLARVEAAGGREAGERDAPASPSAPAASIAPEIAGGATAPPTVEPPADGSATKDVATVGKADGKSDEKPAKKSGKKPPKKKKKKKKSAKKRPPIEFSGGFALRLVYDDNIVHYSDEDLHEFETGPTPGKYSITKAGDWILRPRLDLTAVTRALTGQKLQARLRISSWRYFENGVKNNESMSLLLKHGGFGGGNFQLTFYHAPEAYLRNFRDRPPFTPRSTPLVYTDFSYTSTSLGLAYWRRLTKTVDGKFEVKRSWRYYSRPFLENDTWEWRFGGYLSWRFVKPLKVTGEYLYSRADARAADAIGETDEISNDGDGSYERDSYRLALTIYVPKNPSRIDDVRLSGQYQAYYFTSDRPPEEDRYHVGRKDEVTRWQVSASTRAIYRSASLEGGYRHTERDSSAPWETGEGESIDEDKDYTDDRFWIGMVVPF